MIALHQNPIVIEQARAVLDEMNELCRSLVYAALLTDDGFQVASRGRDTDGGRFASMSSSVQALGDAVARELRIGSTNYVVIASADGHVVQQRVPGHPLVLAGVFDAAETLGTALAISRRAAARMAEELGRPTS